MGSTTNSLGGHTEIIFLQNNYLGCFSAKSAVQLSCESSVSIATLDLRKITTSEADLGGGGGVPAARASPYFRKVLFVFLFSVIFLKRIEK